MSQREFIQSKYFPSDTNNAPFKLMYSMGIYIGCAILHDYKAGHVFSFQCKM